MSDTVFTFPGKLGDSIHQWAVPWLWAQQTGKKFDCWLDEGTCKPVVDLFQSQPCVEEVKLIGGIENYQCGGQPFHFNLETKDFDGRLVFHLGFRSFPARQITLETFLGARVPVKLDQEMVTRTPWFHVEPHDPKKRCVLHGQSVYAHTKSTPGFWKFLATIAPYLESRFDEIVWVGNERDLEVGARTYPKWQTFEDGGSFKKLAELVAGSELMIGVGSAPITLAGALKVPSIRVHDPIGDSPKVIWSNLQEAHLNATEIELRTEWPKWRDKYLEPNPAEIVAQNVAEASL